MTTAPEDKKLLPPYASYIAFMRQLESLRQDGHHLPDQIDRGVLSGMSGSAQTSMLKTLEALGLIDASGRTTKTLRDLLAYQRGSEEFKAQFRAILEKTYGFLLSVVSLRTATTNQVQTAFRTQHVGGSTVSKCIAFFLAAAKEAGIEVSKYVRTPPMAEVVSKKRNAPTRSALVEDEQEDEGEAARSDVFQMTADLHPALQGVLKTLPAPGQPLTDKERKRFMAAFEAVLSLAHPAAEEEPS